MGFQLTINDEIKCNIFTNIFKNIKQFSADINLYFEEERFYTQFIDTGHISLVELNLKNTWFDEYECSETLEPMGINTEIIGKILRCRNKNDSIHISFNEENEDILNLSFIPKNSDNTSIKKQFEIPIMEIETDLLKIPEASTGQADIKMDSSLLSTLVSELEIFGNEIDININEDEIVLETKGDNGKYKINIDIEKIDEFSLDEDLKLNLSFSLKYIIMIMNFSKISRKVYFTLNEDNPIMFQYDLSKKGENTINNNENSDDINDDNNSVSNVDKNSEYNSENEEEINEELEKDNYIRFFLAPKFKN